MPRLATPVAKRATDTLRARAPRPRTPNRRSQIAHHAESLRPADLALGPLFTHTRDAVVVGNADTDRIVLWNPAAERLFDWKAVDAVGQSIGTLISPAIVPLHRASVGLSRALNAEPARPYELAATRRDGSDLRLEVVLVPLDYPGAPERYVMILGRKVSVCQAVADSPAMVEPSASPRLNVQRINLVPLISRVVSNARSRGSRHKLNMALPQGLTASVDAERIEEVLETLIDQAFARCPGGCWIDVDLRRPLTGLARLEVRDFGRPLDADGRRGLADGGQSDAALASARDILEQHGGTLTFEFPADGGVRAVVTLPTQRNRATMPSPAG